MLNRI
jgi:hypothetical protein